MTRSSAAMSSGFALGAPTQYGFDLPRRRHQLARPYIRTPQGTLLDYGCGNGANTVLFAPDVQRIVGLDVVHEHLAEGSAFAAAHELGNLTYILYEGGSLPFRDQSFDRIVTFEVLEHTPDDRFALAELHRVLKPQGIIVLSVPNKWYLMETHGFDVRPTWVPWNRVPLLSWLPTGIHERFARARIYTRRRILRLTESAGFTTLEHRYIMPPFDKVTRTLPRKMLRLVFRGIDQSPLRVLGVAHFIAARRDH